MANHPIVEVCFSPVSYPAYEKDNAIVVIIDILRATSAICTAFEHGAHKIIPVATVQEASDYKKKGYMVGAERDAIKLDGFDFGNSPYHYMGENIKGQTLVLTTTNGTQAIEAAKNATKVVVGAFLNISALCKFLLQEQKNVVLLCSGWKNRFNLEDALFAGAVVNELCRYDNLFAIGDSALASKYLYNMGEVDPDKFLHHSSHKQRLARLGLKEDIKYCLSLDKTSVIPVLQDGCLVIME